MELLEESAEDRVANEVLVLEDLYAAFSGR